MKAIKGTGGIKTNIAKRLKVHRDTIRNLLARPDWADVLGEYEAEVEAGIDEAEETIRYAINQRHDLPTAVGASRWLLAHKRRAEFGENSTLTVQGGNKPITTANMTIDVNALLSRLPIEVKRQLLEAQEQLEAAAEPVK